MKPQQQNPRWYQNPGSKMTQDVDTLFRCSAYCTAETYDLKKLISQNHFPKKTLRQVVHVKLLDGKADGFYFPYGVVVFWGLSQEEEQEFLKQSQAFASKCFDKIESDFFSYTFGEKHHFEHDTISLTSKELLPKLAISHGIAQSVKLRGFEKSVHETIKQTKHIPQELAKKGKIALRRREISQKMGQLFLKRSSVNLHFDLLDTPEFFWEQDQWEPLYRMSRYYLEIPTRIDVLNKRLNMVHELFEILGTELNHRHSSTLEWTIIWLIVIEVIISLGKDVFQLI